jgi:hypothetical protein
MWNFLFKIYGGGPILPFNNIQSQSNSTASSSSTIKPTAFSNKPRTTSLSQTQSTTSTSNTDNFPSRQISTSSATSMHGASLPPQSTTPPKLNNSISDSNLNKNIKKLAADSNKFSKTSTGTNSNNHSGIDSGLILKIPNI